MGLLKDRRARGLRRRGNAARDVHDWGAAIDAYRAYLRLRPDDAAIRVQLGHMLTQQRDYVAADAAYGAAARLIPGDADLLLCWAHSRKAAGDTGHATTLYERSYAIDRNAHAAEALGLDEAAAAQPRVAEAQPEETPPAEDAPSYGGVIEHVQGSVVRGRVFAAEAADVDGAAAPGVEFRVDGHRLQRVLMEDAADGAFSTVLATREDMLVSAHRLSDGRALAGSPFTVSGRRRHHEPPRAWETWLDEVKPLGPPASGELAVFVTHAPGGALKPHVAAYLAALRAQRIGVLLVVVADRQVNIADAVLALVDGAVVRANRGYDFAAWSHALRRYPQALAATTLYLLNDSVLGPADDARLGAVIERVRASAADLIALTESHEYYWHLQTYFLAVKPRLLQSYAFQGFFDRVRLLDDKDAVIRAYELRFAPDMERAGFTTEVLFPSAMALNPTLRDWRGLIARGFPFVKLLLLRGHFPEVDMTGWRQAVEDAGFDLALIDATVAAGAEEVPAEPGHGAFAHPLPAAPADGRKLRIAFYGPWNYDNGLGFAARAMIGALRQLDVQLNLHPIKKPFHIHRALAPAVDIVDFDGPADVAIVHLNPDSWFLLTDEQRHAVRAARRRIGYWVWEMAHIPRAWWHDFGSVDRIWSPSAYCAETFAQADGAAIDVIPHPVPLPAPTGAALDVRAMLGLPADRRLILYMFDGSSYLVRKNPAALIRAFAASGLAQEGWTLALKTKHLMDIPEAGAALRALAEETPQVVLIDRAIGASEVHALIATADIYASPHCSEGFGLTVAEALAAGKLVVATDFGGTRDVLDATTGYPVKAHDWTLASDHGHYTQGGSWARIDEPALCDTLRRAAAAVLAGDTTRGEAGRRRVADTLSYQAVAARALASIQATLTEHGRPHPIAPIHPSLAAGIAPERADFGPDLRVVALAADGAPRAGETSVPAGLEPTRDRWVAFAPAGSRLSPLLPGLLREFAHARPDAGIVYGDDLAVDTAQPIDQLRLKPDFDLTLLGAQDYIGALVMVRATVLAALGGLDPARGTAAVADLLFRAQAAGHAIVRLPEVLLAHPGARVRATDADYAAMLAAQPAFAGHEITLGLAPASFQVVRRFDDPPAVTLVIPTRQSRDAADRPHVANLLDDIARTAWPLDRVRVIVGDDQAGPAEWASAGYPFALDRIETPRDADAPFHYGAKMNRLWRAAATEQIVFLNDDLRLPDPGWLRALQTYAADESVGGVGARLLFPDGRLQHAGLAPHALLAAHMWVFRERAAGTYQEWARVSREWSMVTGAVFATRRSLLERIRGFDESYSVEYNDTDMCLRLRALGYRIVCTAAGGMVHIEKASRGEAPPPAVDTAHFLARWQAWLAQDPSWHPGLRRDRLDMAPAHDGEAWYW